MKLLLKRMFAGRVAAAAVVESSPDLDSCHTQTSQPIDEPSALSGHYQDNSRGGGGGSDRLSALCNLPHYK